MAAGYDRAEEVDHLGRYRRHHRGVSRPRLPLVLARRLASRPLVAPCALPRPLPLLARRLPAAPHVHFVHGVALLLLGELGRVPLARGGGVRVRVTEREGDARQELEWLVVDVQVEPEPDERIHQAVAILLGELRSRGGSGQVGSGRVGQAQAVGHAGEADRADSCDGAVGWWGTQGRRGGNAARELISQHEWRARGACVVREGRRGGEGGEGGGGSPRRPACRSRGTHCS